MTQESVPEPPQTLHDKINRLFAVVRPAGEPHREYQNKEVVAALRAAGREISESHLSELRRGIKDNPTIRTVEALASFFQVRPGYFTDPQAAAEVEADLARREATLRAAIQAHADEAQAERELLEAIRAAGVSGLAHRTAGMTSSERTAMLKMLAQIIRDEA